MRDWVGISEGLISSVPQENITGKLRLCGLVLHYLTNEWPKKCWANDPFLVSAQQWFHIFKFRIVFLLAESLLCSLFYFWGKRKKKKNKSGASGCICISNSRLCPCTRSLAHADMTEDQRLQFHVRSHQNCLRFFLFSVSILSYFKSVQT